MAPHDFHINLCIAVYDQKHGKLQDAIVRYQAALADAPDQENKIKIATNIAVSYRDLGNMPKALEWLQKVRELRATPEVHGRLHRDD